MSTSRQLSECRAIPTRTVLINDTTQLPHDYCTTPGGTLFSTTPGGTRIIYDRKFLLDRRNSPIAQTPPAHLPVIPGVTSQNVLRENKKNEANKHIIKHDGKPATGKCYNIDQEIFLCNRECFVGIVISSPFLLHHVTHTLTLYVL
uniref:Eukaryotic translation initiation factor 4E binding protein 2 n=1 Tax=Gasterosteus aculeatus aculeatus TaxID=481459 RepID=A0AAQ4QSC0_GASAC